MFAALSLAVGLTAIGWCALLALRRGGSDPAATRFVTPGLAPPPAPERLLPAPEFARTATGATHQEAVPRVAVPLRLRNATAVLRQAGAGVALYRADTGGDFTWVPLAGAVAHDGVVELAPAVRSRGEFVVTVAAGPRFARHGYIARGSLRIAGGATPPVEIDAVEIDANAAEITFVLPPRQPRVGPFRLVRAGDPQWAAMQPVCAGMMIGGEGSPPLLLGFGTYELIDPLVPERRQAFVVAAPAKVEISAAMAVARADRP